MCVLLARTRLKVQKQLKVCTRQTKADGAGGGDRKGGRVVFGTAGENALEQFARRNEPTHTHTHTQCV